MLSNEEITMYAGICVSQLSVGLMWVHIFWMLFLAWFTGPRCTTRLQRSKNNFVKWKIIMD